MVQGAAGYFAGVDAGLVEGACKECFHADELVLGVEKEHGKTLVWQVCKVQLRVLGGKLVLEAGDTIAGLASAASDLVLTGSVVEMS